MFWGVGGLARLPGKSCSVEDVSETLEPPRVGVRVSCAVTSTGWFPVFTAVMAPAHMALASDEPSAGRESAMSVASSTATTLTLLRDMTSLLEFESAEDESFSHDAVICNPEEITDEASQYRRWFAPAPGLRVTVLLSTNTPSTFSVTFPTACDPPMFKTPTLIIWFSGDRVGTPATRTEGVVT